MINPSFTVREGSNRGTETKPANRNFGLLQVRKMKLKQSEAIVHIEKEQGLNFAHMSNERLIKIAQGNNLEEIRALSKYFFQTNGMYARAVRYLSDIYRYDFMVYPNLDFDDELKEGQTKTILKKFNEVLEHFDNSAIQLMARKWAIQVCLEGVYYGYICDDINDKLVVQDLPVNFCRSRFLHRGLPLVEFNVKYFDKVTNDPEYRNKLLSLFPEEFQIGYRKFKAGKLPAEEQGDDAGWIMLDINRAFKFSFNAGGGSSAGADTPPFLSAIPALIELSEVQDLEKEKLLQDLQKILVQTFELDKNGQIPFTMPELQRLNQNAIDMVGDAVGISVLSTVANVHLEDVSSQKGSESQKNTESAENSVYNDLGISTNLFNTEGNLALEKSIITDEAYVKPLLLQFEQFFNRYLEWKFNKNTLKFRLKMLTTSIFNYKDLSSVYKDLTKIGFSRFLPMVALGHTQKEVVSMAKLEQQIMQLDAYMLPPFSSNTMSSDTWSDIKAQQQQILAGRKPGDPQMQPGQQPGQQPAKPAIKDNEPGANGRPELPDDKKSDKTIANRAAQG